MTFVTGCATEVNYSLVVSLESTFSQPCIDPPRFRGSSCTEMYKNIDAYTITIDVYGAYIQEILQSSIL